MPSSQGTTADAILAQLAAGGVKRLYGVIGDAVFPFADALTRQSAIQFVPATHEANAAFMASYEAKLTKSLAACIATSGPGATNLAAGLADAWQDRAPVIGITGQVETCKLGTQAKQYFDQQAFFNSVAASSQLVLTPDVALQELITAMTHSVSRSTATHLSIPKDVQAHPIQWRPFPLGRLENETSGQSLIWGDWSSTVQALRKAARPLIVLGIADEAVVAATLRLAEALGAALVVAQQVKGSVPFAHQRLIGGIGEAHVPAMVEQIDLALLIGESSYELAFLPQGVSSVVVNKRPIFPPKNPVMAELIGDPVGLLNRLVTELDGVPYDADWQEAIHRTRVQLDEQIQQVLRIDNPNEVNPYRLAIALGSVLPEDAIIAVDVGSFSHWFDLGFRANCQHVLTSHQWRGMGLGMPAAIAASLCQPKRQAVALVGDGAFLMSMAELVTAVRFQLPILVVVANNGCYDIEEQKMVAEGLAPCGTDLVLPDIPALARSCGAEGYRVDAPSQLDKTLREALRGATTAHRPVLVDVTTGVPRLPHIQH